MGRTQQRAACSAPAQAVAVLFDLLALCFEVGGVWLLARADESLRALAASGCAHLAAAGFVWVAAMVRTDALRLAVRCGFARGLWLLSLAVPILGVAQAVLLQLGPLTARGRRHGGDSWQSRRAEAMDLVQQKRRDAQEVTADASALVDALRDPNKSVRLAALEALRDDTSPRAVRVLRRARRNTIADVRMLAAEGLDRIAGHYARELASARREAQQASDDPEARLAAARASLGCAKAGLEPGRAAQVYAAEAVSHCRAVLARGARSDAWILLGEALRHMGRHKGAEAVYRYALSCDPGNLEAAVGLAESLFCQRDTAALTQTARWLLRGVGGQLEPQIRSALLFCLGSPRADTPAVTATAQGGRSEG